MPYASGRVIHDADAHIMEVPGFLTEHLEARYRNTINDDVLFPRDRGRGLHKLMRPDAGRAALEQDESQIMLHKNWDALGSFTKEDRPRSIDLLGFASQLMFTTQLLNFSALLEGKATSTRSTRSHAPTPATWSSSARSTSGCCPRATCRWPTSNARRSPRERRSRWAPRA